MGLPVMCSSTQRTPQHPRTYLFSHASCTRTIHFTNVQHKALCVIWVTMANPL